MSMLILFSTGCVETFDPNIDDYESVYVVDGEINNLPGPYEVRLSQSYEYDELEPSMVSGATVMILDDQGNQVSLEEVEKGVYHTTDLNFQGIPGRQYKLRIEISEELIFESEYEEMYEPIDIGRLYWEYERRPWANENGIQILIDADDPTNRAKYFAWEYEEYWKFSVIYRSQLIYPDEYVCWDSSMVNQRTIASTAGHSKNIIRRQPLYFVSNRTSRLERRYTTLVRQYVLSEEAYQFHKQLQQINANTGTLFDAVPYTLQGNMRNVINPDMPVLGLFQVSPVTEARIYVNNSELPSDLVVDDAIQNCIARQIYSLDTISIDTLEFFGYQLFDSIHYEGDPAYTYAYANKAECFLCSLTGTKKEPSFWEE